MDILARQTSTYAYTSSSCPMLIILIPHAHREGISSDQFFGRDQDDPDELRSKLDQFSNSKAISSDMMYSSETTAKTTKNRAGDPTSISSSSSDKNNSTFDKLKSSVAGFFDGFN